MGKLSKFLGWMIALAVIVGGGLRLLLFEPWTIPDDAWLAVSMAPTLAAGDQVLLLTRGTPKQGDLVRCADPEKAGEFVVGRIVGMPGDSVEVMADLLRINNNNYNSGDACDQPTTTVLSPETGTKVELLCSRVEMGGGWNYIGVMRRRPNEGVKKLVVGAGRVFLVSDDRDIHDDSRDFGELPIESCNRRIVFRLWSAQGWSDGNSRMTVVH